MSQSACTLVYRVLLDLSDHRLQVLRQLLTPEERARADRYLVPHATSQYIGCRAALRWLLAQTMDSAPDRVVIKTERWGKPYLSASIQADERTSNKSEVVPPLYFNVSHSGQLGLIALSPGIVGVDIEHLKPRIHARSLVAQVLSTAEQQAWSQLPAHRQVEQILRLWVCKESLLKAMGLGIAECLKMVSFKLPIEDQAQIAVSQIEPAIQLHLEEADNCHRHLWTSPHSWRIHRLPVDQDYFAVVATQSNQLTVSTVDFQWPEEFS